MLIDEFGAEFATDPPCQPASAGLSCREYDGELGGNIEIFRHDPGATIRYVEDRAVARQRANAEMHFRAPVAGVPLAFPSIRKHRESQRHSPFGSRSRFTENPLEFA
jgi:hypothetical protein